MILFIDKLIIKASRLKNDKGFVIGNRLAVCTCVPTKYNERGLLIPKTKCTCWWRPFHTITAAAETREYLRKLNRGVNV